MDARGFTRRAIATGPHQSINQRSSQSNTRAGEKPHPSTTTAGANLASRSDAGLGGYERVATALVCETRSFSTPFIFQWRATCVWTRGLTRSLLLVRRPCLALTRYWFTSKLYCGSQFSLYCSPHLQSPTYCNTIARRPLRAIYAAPPTPPFYAIHHTIYNIADDNIV